MPGSVNAFCPRRRSPAVCRSLRRRFASGQERGRRGRTETPSERKEFAGSRRFLSQYRRSNGECCRPSFARWQSTAAARGYVRREASASGRGTVEHRTRVIRRSDVVLQRTTCPWPASSCRNHSVHRRRTSGHEESSDPDAADCAARHHARRWMSRPHRPNLSRRLKSASAGSRAFAMPLSTLLRLSFPSLVSTSRARLQEGIL